MISEDISYLSTYHAHIPDSECRLRDDESIFRLSETLDPHSHERISDEESCRFPIFFPDSELPTTELIIIHSREIIMDE